MTGFLTATSSISCPHGGVVIPIPTSQVSCGADPALVSTDTFTVGGCGFVLVLVPHPCVLVQWVAAATRCSSGQTPMLTLDSVGLCVAADGAVQGPAIIQSTQPSAVGL
jgi:hypothetical protein